MEKANKLEKIKSNKENTQDNNNLVEEDYSLGNLTGFKPEVFALNVSKFIKNLKSRLRFFNINSILVLQGGVEIPRNDSDSFIYHFYQDPNFYYLTGINEPNFYLVLDFLAENVYVLMKTPTEHDMKYTRVPSLTEIWERYNIKCYQLEKLWELIRTRDPEVIYRLKGTNSDSNLSVKTAELNPEEEFKYLLNRVVDDERVYEVLADTRTRKSNYEKEIMKTCCSKGVEAHVETIKTVAPLIIERKLENAFIKYLRKNAYSREYPYEYVCGSGINSATLHYGRNDQILNDGDLVLMDMGLRLGGYCCDITSTVPVNGKFTQKQKEIYDLVLNANRTVMQNIRPGVFWPEMHLLAEKIILRGLQNLGLLSKDFSVDEMLENRVCYYFMPHGLGHFIGLDTHDVGGYLSFTPKRYDLPGLKSLRTARYLEEGNVITVEPGCYFIRYLLQKAFVDPKLRKYFNETKISNEYYTFGGVRIEDMVYVSSTCCENLTSKLPRLTEEIEELMKKTN